MKIFKQKIKTLKINMMMFKENKCFKIINKNLKTMFLQYFKNIRKVNFFKIKILSKDYI